MNKEKGKFLFNSNFNINTIRSFSNDQSLKINNNLFQTKPEFFIHDNYNEIQKKFQYEINENNTQKIIQDTKDFLDKITLSEFSKEHFQTNRENDQKNFLKQITNPTKLEKRNLNLNNENRNEIKLNNLGRQTHIKSHSNFKSNTNHTNEISSNHIKNSFLLKKPFEKSSETNYNLENKSSQIKHINPKQFSNSKSNQNEMTITKEFIPKINHNFNKNLKEINSRKMNCRSTIEKQEIYSNNYDDGKNELNIKNS